MSPHIHPNGHKLAIYLVNFFTYIVCNSSLKVNSQFSASILYDRLEERIPEKCCEK